MKFTFIETGNGGNSLQLKILENTKPTRNFIRTSFADYGVKYCEEGDYDGDGAGCTMPTTRMFDMKKNYLKYMSSHYKGYQEDCINFMLAELENKKQAELAYLNDVFAANHTDNL